LHRSNASKDGSSFDRLVHALSVAGSRRVLLGLISTPPLFGGLLASLAPDESDANGRRKRRKN
jgi:hypothetical protein